MNMSTTTVKPNGNIATKTFDLDAYIAEKQALEAKLAVADAENAALKAKIAGLEEAKAGVVTIACKRYGKGTLSFSGITSSRWPFSPYPAQMVRVKRALAMA